MRRRIQLAASAGLLAGVVGAQPAAAGKADVVSVDVDWGTETCSFSVRVRHADTGWDHYADRWEVLAPDDGVLATRVLRHPHVDEQPFTRNLAGVRIPEGVTRVWVRAHDSQHGFGGEELEVEIPSRGAAE